MKKTFLFLFTLFLFTYSSYAQLLVENFNYSVGSLLTDNGYTAHSGAGTNSISVIAGNLIYPNYPSSGQGNSIRLINTGEDVHDSLSTVVSTGTVYASFLVKVDTARNAGEYFFHLGPAPISTTFRTRTFVKLGLNGNLAFGLSKGSTSATVLPAYTDSIYTAGTTYLIVVAYKIVDGADNDTVKLWVNPAITPNEPVANLIVTDTNAGGSDVSIGTYAFRQGTAAAGPYLVLSGFRVATSWGDILPVELVSFKANVTGNAVQLNWVTASELNNQGFDVERKSANSTWQKIGFVQGNGTTSSTKSYSYTDGNLETGKYSYRLKQIDFDGSYEYSNAVEADVTTLPVKFDLAQNFPNPFNPTTTINYAIPQASNVTLKVYNMLGQEVKTLINRFMEAGDHSIKFDAKDLNSGLYFYKLEAGSFNMVKKMTLLK